jgi:hypothetical protein
VKTVPSTALLAVGGGNTPFFTTHPRLVMLAGLAHDNAAHVYPHLWFIMLCIWTNCVPQSLQMTNNEGPI